MCDLKKKHPLKFIFITLQSKWKQVAFIPNLFGSTKTNWVQLNRLVKFVWTDVDQKIGRRFLEWVDLDLFVQDVKGNNVATGLCVIFAQFK